jgi:transposase
MPRTCLACSHSERDAIDKALVSREPLRNIAKRVSISPAGLLRHRSHVAQAIVKASQNREERLGDSLLDDMRRVQRKAWELLSRTESEGDHRGSIVALREVRECLQSLGEMLAKAEEKTRQLDAGTHAEMSIEQVRQQIDELMLKELGPELHAKWRERRAQLEPFFCRVERASGHPGIAQKAADGANCLPEAAP